MANRFNNAVNIQAGACNPTGITLSLLDAMREVRDEGADTKGICSDPAVRAIAHQLAYLLNIAEMDNSGIEYANVMAQCNLRASTNNS